MANANKSNITKRGDLSQPLSYQQGDTNFNELINIIEDVSFFYSPNAGQGASLISMEGSGNVQSAIEARAQLSGGADANFTTTPQVNGSDVYAQNNIVGTVSQTLGVPTGAIFEHGSNANGYYVKFADGTAFAWHTPMNGYSANINYRFDHPMDFDTSTIGTTGWATSRADSDFDFSYVVSIDNSYLIFRSTSTTSNFLKPFVMGVWYD